MSDEKDVTKIKIGDLSNRLNPIPRLCPKPDKIKIDIHNNHNRPSLEAQSNIKISLLDSLPTLSPESDKPEKIYLACEVSPPQMENRLYKKPSSIMVRIYLFCKSLCKKRNI